MSERFPEQSQPAQAPIEGLVTGALHEFIVASTKDSDGSGLSTEELAKKLGIELPDEKE